ncbi:hypothetical protein P879_02932 [Paragonimus westermani]|uniref:Fibronectin type-III domain-containing protein n=1 Tax=Paragonimus westermani TaxID=34504 RepID=A0A8T0DXW2_9TREM|nr:hypothetical protein P879_02932 [Paragonimus westermani]
MQQGDNASTIQPTIFKQVFSLITYWFSFVYIAPSSPPQVFHATVVSPTSVLITWKPPLESNGRITGYKVYYTTRPEDPVSSWLVARTSEERHHITQLASNATYYLKANAYNAAGDGPFSEVLPIIVTPGVPSGPTNFHGTSVDPTTIRLGWKAPDVPAGAELLGYQLRYRAASSDKSTVMHSDTTKATQTVAIGPDMTEYFLKGLEPSTLYYLNLAGRTATGLGVGAQIEVTTKDYSFDLPAPSGVHLRSLTTNSAKLCWLRPDLPNRLTRSVLGYELLFGTATEATDPANATGVIPLPRSICCCFTMMHLSPGTDYRVWLRLIRQSTEPQPEESERPNQPHSGQQLIDSWIDDSMRRIAGPVSEPQAFRTLVNVPEMPQGRKILVHGPNTIQVTWNGPKERTSDIRHYKLTWKCLDCIPATTAATDQQDTDIHHKDLSQMGQRKVLANYGSSPTHLYTATIGDLIPDTSYQISVAAANMRGLGESYTYPVVRTKVQGE